MYENRKSLRRSGTHGHNGHKEQSQSQNSQLKPFFFLSVVCILCVLFLVFSVFSLSPSLTGRISNAHHSVRKLEWMCDAPRQTTTHTHTHSFWCSVTSVSIFRMFLFARGELMVAELLYLVFWFNFELYILLARSDPTRSSVCFCEKIESVVRQN